MYIAVANYIAVATGKNTVLPFSMSIPYLVEMQVLAIRYILLHLGNFCTNY